MMKLMNYDDNSGFGHGVTEQDQLCAHGQKWSLLEGGVTQCHGAKDGWLCVWKHFSIYSGGPSSSKLMHGIQSRTVSWLSFLYHTFLPV